MSVIAGSNNRLIQKRSVRRDGWTPAKRALFLDALEASCNIRRAAEAAGMTDGTARALRRRDAAFALAWQEALDLGCERIRAEMLARALEGLGDGLTPDAADRIGTDSEPMDDAMRLKVLQQCGAAREGRTGRHTRPQASAEQAIASLISKLEKIEKRLAAEARPVTPVLPGVLPAA